MMRTRKEKITLMKLRRLNVDAQREFRQRRRRRKERFKWGKERK
jgi:hypothetical protein